MSLALPSLDPQPLGPGVYRTDAFHRRPLFAVSGSGIDATDGQPLVVGSWLEAHALHGPAGIADLNPTWLGAFISGEKSADQAPYRRIARLPRAHQVTIAGDGRVQTDAYDPFAGGAAAMAAEPLHGYLREGLLDHLRRELAGVDGPIGCEHSSGIDSNAVLGALMRGLAIPAEQIHTWSLESCGEGPLLEQFRPFHHLCQEQVYVDCSPEASGQNSSNSLADHQLARQLDAMDWLGAPAQTGGMLQALAHFRGAGCEVILSGFGGDQALSHNAANVPTDLVAQGRWHELVAWLDGSRRQALKTGLGRVLALVSRPWAMAKVLERTSEFCSSDLLQRSLTVRGKEWLGPHLGSTYPWEIDGYLRQHESIRQRVLDPWVALRAEEETRLAAGFGLRKLFPLLDEPLIATLLHQDVALFGERAGHGRLLARRAFAPFLPPFLQATASKRRELDEGYQDLVKRRHQVAIARGLARLADWHPLLGQWWQLDQIVAEASAIAEKPDPSPKEAVGTGQALRRLEQLSQWLERLE